MLDYNKTVEDVIKSGVNMAILPIGSTEQHGPHLPMCTDSFVVTEVCKKVAMSTGAYLLPTLPISTCYEHKGKKGSVWIRPNTFYLVIQDIILSLRGQGFNQVAVFLGHGGIFIAGPAIRELNAVYDNLKVAKVDFMQFLVDNKIKSMLDFNDNLHACEYETSLMLFLNEKIVKKDKIEEADYVPNVPRDFLNYSSLIKLSKTGVWGKPSLATKEKGEKIFNVLVEMSINYMNEVFENMEYGEW